MKTYDRAAVSAVFAYCDLLRNNENLKMVALLSSRERTIDFFLSMFG